MRPAFLILGVLAASLLGCGVPTEDHQEIARRLERTTEELDAATRRIAELEAEVQELRETDEAYWAEILDLKKEAHWPEVRTKAAELLARWPHSSYADRARSVSKEATQEIAQRLYDQAQEEIKRKRFEAAKRTLLQVRDEYPDTPARFKAIVDLRNLDKLIEEARRRAIGNGRWRVSSNVSMIDDSTNVYVSLPADDTISGQFGAETRPSLWIRCKENQTEVFVNWDVYLGIDSTRVLERLDDERARTRTWSISTDHKATFYQGSRIDFARNLMAHNKLLLQLTPYGESPVTAIFSLPGLENALVQLRESCGW